MPEATFTPSNDEFNMAFNGQLALAKTNGLNTTDHKVLKFIQDNAEFIACLHAENRFLQNILHDEDLK